MEADIDMSLTQEILAAMPANQADAMTSAELFKVCKSAESVNQIAKLLSALSIKNVVYRKPNTIGNNQYWLAKRPDGKVNKLHSLPPEPDEETYEIPAFLRKVARENQEFTAADSVEEKLSDQYAGTHKTNQKTWIDDEKQRLADEKLIHLGLAANHIKTTESVPEAPFKIAITSDKTLILFGLSYQPIELSKAQTAALSEFCRELDLEAYLT